MEIKNEKEKKKNNNNQKQVMLCGLFSGIITKAVFAPFDRIKLFYQIQPMFAQVKKNEKKTRHKKLNSSNFMYKNGCNTKNILFNDLNKTDTKNKQYINNIKLNHNKYVKNKNIVFNNFQTYLTIIKNNNIVNNNRKKQRLKRINTINYGSISNTASKLYSYPTNSLHSILKKFSFDYRVNTLYLNNLCKTYTLLNTNSIIKNIIKKKTMFLKKAKNTNQAIKYQTILQSIGFIIKEEGLLGLWKGNFVNTVRGGVVYASKFGTNDLIKDRYKAGKIKKETGSIHLKPKYDTVEGYKNDNTQHKQEKIKFNYYESVIAGYAAGITQKTLSYPLDLLSIRVALGINEKYLTADKSLYQKKSVFQIIREIKNNEGFKGFFKGYVPTLLTGVPYVTLQMLFFDLYKNIFTNYFTHSYNSIGSVALYSSLAGSLSNITSVLIVFPGDTVRKRMMNNGIDNKNYIYKNTLHCIKNIYYQEGLRNFYYGLFPSMLKALPSGAIQFMSYEMLKYMLL
ncbi:mitochondrial carrier protein, putative [Hepatocystis sp. ex Piliocolobus tephrosceles]|nr:mitochondrial carrier protein, putative [Hepatocystis sp. ex Piliocolobus tephrosceles]VWU51013.1 mitochondrial carrier protein, putative [Hepatocystis sp. ex Piliocolobus tephrosceles]